MGFFDFFETYARNAHVYSRQAAIYGEGGWLAQAGWVMLKCVFVLWGQAASGDYTRYLRVGITYKLWFGCISLYFDIFLQITIDIRG